MKKILLVDDDVDMTKIVARWLEKAGYEVTVTLSGAHALNELKQSGFDLVLLDFAMPDMDGEATLNAIRSEGMDVKVIFRTGVDDTDIEDVIARCKAQGYVSKSDGKAKLLSQIEKTI